MNAAELTEKGIAAYGRGDANLASIWFERAWSRSADPTAAANLSIALARTGDFDSATEFAEEAYLLRPQDRNIRTAYGESLFREGRWLEAWEHWFPVIENPFQTTAEEYNGQDLKGKEVLVVPAGGYGDVFMLSRYIPELQKFGCQVSFAATADMVPVFLKQPFMQSVNMTQKRDWNIWMHLFHFPKLFQMTPDNVLWNGPYIEPFPRQDGPLRIGVRLGAGEKGDKFRFRSVPGDVGEKFLEEISSFDAEIVPLTLGSGLTENWIETIALISSCDLVLCADTSVLHLAGAMGKPTWALLGDFTDPKWLRDRSDTPWYPSMRLFRGNGKGFKNTIEQVTQALSQWLVNQQKENLNA